jgi:hypothetical protein
MPDDTNVTPLKPPPDEATSKASLISPERKREISARIADVFITSMTMVADAKAAGQADEIAALRARIERLERIVAPRTVDGDER